MKQTLAILLLITLLLSSCDNREYRNTCRHGVIKILNKNRHSCARGPGFCRFEFYLYDGEIAYSCYTDEATWNMYDINDTLPTLIITRTFLK